MGHHRRDGAVLEHLTRLDPRLARLDSVKQRRATAGGGGSEERSRRRGCMRGCRGCRGTLWWRWQRDGATRCWSRQTGGCWRAGATFMAKKTPQTIKSLDEINILNSFFQSSQSKTLLFIG
jgi:hypothetical protein